MCSAGWVGNTSCVLFKKLLVSIEFATQLDLVSLSVCFFAAIPTMNLESSKGETLVVVWQPIFSRGLPALKGESPESSRSWVQPY
nr:hypothetical protein Iba_chr06aCG17690 [Ipomoea batatas]